ncbi:hypothetical protein kam1_1361 [Methylacidiphilum kamchatkense Kam1]|uniref:Uncharacterized protein n=1 Tax=Methylacidiphilum kamchatkense Kam1 TaxID=1202785 RepID=A0A516TMW5_9BACT|nr:hypothetical protein kam1_1361 [Methylacidiphilum kamchatkense Kam1]
MANPKGKKNVKIGIPYARKLCRSVHTQKPEKQKKEDSVWLMNE